MTFAVRSIAVVVAALMAALALAGSVAAQGSTPADQPVTVGETEITWEGDWELDTSSSVDGQVALVKMDPTAQQLTLATYAEVADPTVSEPEAALDTFAESFFEGAGADAVSASAGGELEDGSLWKLYDFDLQSFELSMVVTMNQHEDGTYTVSALVSNTDGFAEALEIAQEEIFLNGEPIFLDGMDGEELGDASATPTASPASTPAD